MATAKEADIASAFLRGIGGKDTPLMRKAVIAWLRAESGSRIIGNNPWNITYGAAQEIARKGGPSPTGYRVHSITGMKFATYRTVEDGAAASGKLLVGAGHDWRNYDKIVTAARRGDPIGFLNALAKSAWDAGRYGTKNGGKNKLVIIYGGIAGLSTVQLADALKTFPGKEADDKVNAKLLAAWGGIVKLPVGHIVTAGDVDDMIVKLKAAGFFNQSIAGNAISENVVRGILSTAIGKPWDKSLQDDLQARFFKSATEAVPKPLGDLAAIAETLAGVAGTVLNPGNWIRILALGAGAVMVSYGTINVLKASGAPVAAPATPKVDSLTPVTRVQVVKAA